LGGWEPNLILIPFWEPTAGRFPKTFPLKEGPINSLINPLLEGKPSLILKKHSLSVPNFMEATSGFKAI